MEVIYITDRNTVQNLPSPLSVWALFIDGGFVGHAPITDKKFLKLAGIQ